MSHPELELDREISQKLARTWDAFFARHGRLTAVQRAAIPAILEGQSVLLSAPTAAGKTEAACAPIVERMLRRSDPWRVLYISPTRALANDLYERLAGPLDRVGVTVARRTGEHKTRAEDAHVLLTTPESFDSMLCRGRREDGHMLAMTSAVVLDEIHLLNASARGEQLRWLLLRLTRLRRFAKSEQWVRDDAIQRVALSATVPDFESVRTRYVPGGVFINVGGGRTIEEVTLPEGPLPSELAVASYIGAGVNSEKLLVFCNSRHRVDKLSLELRKLVGKTGYQVLAHHGSLGQKERELAEETARSSRKIILVATSTLEIGVDIGDIDVVVLDAPALDVSALLQRLGRGNRRSGHTRVLVCGNSAGEFLIHKAMLESARVGRLGVASGGPRLAVAIQQVCSFIFQSRDPYRQMNTVESFVKEALPDLDPRELIDHLVETEVLRLQNRRLSLGEDVLEQTVRGEMHSNIESAGGLSVINEKTGSVMATGVVHKGARNIGVGGVSSEVRQVGERAIHVRSGTNAAPEEGGWSYKSRPAVSGPGQPTAIREMLGFSADQWPHSVVNGQSVIFHMGDARMEALIRLAMEMHPVRESISVDSWTIRFDRRVESLPAWLTSVDGSRVRAAVAADIEKAERMLARPYSNRKLPEGWRKTEFEGWLDIEGGISRLKSASLVPANGRALEPHLFSLLELIDS